MSDALLGTVRKRVSRVLLDEDTNPGKGAPPIDRIMAYVETALVLARREAWREAWATADRFHLATHPTKDAAHTVYPLPTRTRQVLREEPVPGCESLGVLYRVCGGVLEMWPGSGLWQSMAGMAADRFDLMAHALDLRANPYRTEEEPGDESDPWGDAVTVTVTCACTGCLRKFYAADTAALRVNGWAESLGQAGRWLCPMHARQERDGTLC